MSPRVAFGELTCLRLLVGGEAPRLSPASETPIAPSSPLERPPVLEVAVDVDLCTSLSDVLARFLL